MDKINVQRVHAGREWKSAIALGITKRGNELLVLEIISDDLGSMGMYAKSCAQPELRPMLQHKPELHPNIFSQAQTLEVSAAPYKYQDRRS